MKTWYVYKITFDDHHFYYGYRSTKLLPCEDFLIKYFSSSKIVKEKIKECAYHGSILKTFDNQIDAYNYEQNLIFDELSNPYMLNIRCYKERQGFGILSKMAKQKISETSKQRWSCPEYKERLSAIHKERWDSNDQRKIDQINRLKGKERPEHSKTMSGRTLSEEQKQKLRKPKHPGHGARVSAALTGVPKTEDHKQKLRKPKPLVVCRISDRREMALGNFMNWNKSQTNKHLK
jgi:hypothetical protein